MIAVIDYGVANLGSILNMLRRVGADASVVTTAGEVRAAEKLILPGVGAFDQGMQALVDRGLVEALRARVLEDGVPILGICLGMQLLGLRSEEGTAAGLGLINASARRFDPGAGYLPRVPHIGWAQLATTRSDQLLSGLSPEARFYFVHSYHVECADQEDVLATADYGRAFTAVVRRGNVLGAQFHPEKSHRFGMRLLGNFAEL